MWKPMKEKLREGRGLPIADSPTISLPDILKLLLMVSKCTFSSTVHSASRKHPGPV